MKRSIRGFRDSSTAFLYIIEKVNDHMSLQVFVVHCGRVLLWVCLDVEGEERPNEWPHLGWGER